MSFRARIDANPETLAKFEQAWKQRYIEGMRLLEDEATRTGGVYLLGYVAEMILKVAYFRFTGASSDDLLGNLLKAKAFKDASESVSADTESNHSLQFWTEMLIVTRNQNNRRLPTHLQDTLVGYGVTLHQNWKVDIRYQPLAVAAQE